MRRHLSYANVTATLALVFALAGGAAYAVNRINSHDIANNSVRSIDLKNRKGIRGKDVKPNSLTGKQINERTLSATSLARLAGNATGTECTLQVAPRTCVAANVEVSRRSDLLVIATGNQESLSASAETSCSLAIDGAQESLEVHPGEARSDNTDVLGTNGFARTLKSRFPVQAGRHTVALRCKRLLGQARIDEPTIAVIAIAAG
jgi:hypothetical protein